MKTKKQTAAAAAPTETVQPAITTATSSDAAAPAKAKSSPKPAKQASASVVAKPAKGDKAQKSVKAEKAPKTKKPKLVRDSFTMPEAEYEQIAGLKKRLLDKGMATKKRELLRAGVVLLAGLNDVDLVAAAQKIAVIKTGRPVAAAK